VPTPFDHLALAEEILNQRGLSGPVRDGLLAARPAFLLGNTAPDFGTICGIPRARTHFFEMPMEDRRPAHLRLLSAFPELRQPHRLDRERAAFVAGYLLHLWLDQAWIATIFEPIFGPTVARQTFAQRLIDHNLLRAYLDQNNRERLPNDIHHALQGASPEAWLPFAPDNELRRWRDLLVDQVTPGGNSQTVAVFAERLGVPASDFAPRLASSDEMQQAVFRYLPLRRLAAFRRYSLGRSIELLTAYWTGRLDSASSVNCPFRRKAVLKAHPAEGAYESH